MSTFPELVASRRQWIETVLMPWCQTASRSQLRLAELEWSDIAGRVSPEKSLWAWAWSRFPELVNKDLGGIDESLTVRVTMLDGSSVTGHPDARASEHGQLVLLARSQDSGQWEQQGPFSMDEISGIERVPRASL